MYDIDKCTWLDELDFVFVFVQHFIKRSTNVFQKGEVKTDRPKTDRPTFDRSRQLTESIRFIQLADDN